MKLLKSEEEITTSIGVVGHWYERYLSESDVEAKKDFEASLITCLSTILIGEHLYLRQFEIVNILLEQKSYIDEFLMLKSRKDMIEFFTRITTN